MHVDGPLHPAFWGLAGAFIWAGPEWLGCAFSGRGMPLRCSLELVVRLIAGGIAAAAFGPWAAELLGASKFLPAVASAIGMVAVPTAPRLVQVLSGRIVKIAQGKGSSTDEP